ncbi:MAG: transcriptional repressor [Candidatus Omnitrophica bacterium]|nr:transcriptional repressor [Candidatus Omnitrophota bacterium]
MPKIRVKAESWEDSVRVAGFRMTQPRREIMKVLESTEGHLTAEDIYLQVHEIYPNIGLTTVYRNLEFLNEHGIVAKICFQHGKAKYELAEQYSPVGHHHHLVCDECTKIINYNDFMQEEVEFLETVERGLSRRYKFRITHHEIQFNGLCQDCQDKEDQS